MRFLELFIHHKSYQTQILWQSRTFIHLRFFFFLNLGISELTLKYLKSDFFLSVTESLHAVPPSVMMYDHQTVFAPR